MSTRKTVKKKPTVDSPGLNSLTFSSLADPRVKFELSQDSTMMTISNPQDAWNTMYHLSRTEALQLANWIRRNVKAEAA